MKNNRYLFLVQFSILIAIEVLFCFTPLGSLPAIGPIVATLMMMPVIITALLFGSKAGSVMGALAGLFSFIIWTFMPPSPLSAFVFTPFYSLGKINGNWGSVFICFAPRILSGTITGLTYKSLNKIIPSKHYLNLIISSAIGSLTNTVGVLGGIWLFFENQYSSLSGQSILLVIGLNILTSGIPEAVVNAIFCPAICKAIKSIMIKNMRTKFIK